MLCENRCRTIVGMRSENVLKYKDPQSALSACAEHYTSITCERNFVHACLHEHRHFGALSRVLF